MSNVHLHPTVPDEAFNSHACMHASHKHYCQWPYIVINLALRFCFSMQASHLGSRICISRKVLVTADRLGIRHLESSLPRPFPRRKNNVAAYRCQAARPAAGGKSASCSNIFDLLGLPRSSTAGEIRAGYRLRAKELHPDLNKQEDAAEEFHHLQKVYKVRRNCCSLQPYLRTVLLLVLLPCLSERKTQRRRPQQYPSRKSQRSCCLCAWTLRTGR